MRSKLSAYIEMSLAMVLFGSMVVVGKLVSAALPVFLASELRLLVAAAVLVPLLASRQDRPRSVGRRDWLLLALVALTGQVLFYVLMLHGLGHTTAANAGIVIATLPAATAWLASLVLGERSSGRVILAVALASAGVVALRGMGAQVARAGDFLGIGLVLLAVLADAAAIVLAKRISGEVSALAISAAVAVLGAVMLAPFAAPEALAFDWSAFGTTDLLYLLYYGTAATALPSFLWMRGIRKVSGAVAGVFTGVLPLSAVGLSYVILGEHPRPAHGAGLLLVLAAIALMARAKPR